MPVKGRGIDDDDACSSCGAEAQVFYDGADYCMDCWQALYAPNMLLVFQN